MSTSPEARLWVLLARNEPYGVIFRRGPSKQVMLIKWNTRRDTFEHGQWFKGRVYERRCDVSPNGEFLIYFAAKQKPPLYSWTAISKPPYFTAIALWPKGDCWNGGGWFMDDKRIRLNHSPDEAKLQPGFQPGPIKIVGYGEYRGENSTVWDIVRSQNGWKRIAAGNYIDRGSARGWKLSPPQRWQKPHPREGGFTLEMTIVGIGGKDVPWYQIEYRVLISTGGTLDLGLVDWADWDHRGDLIFAKKGAIFRQEFRKSIFAEPRQIADFNSLKFEEVVAPSEACRW
ncbi:MAG TPA: hypothetical protein VMF08_05785 [Candidatus Sulfotelmatobacter sp.]|nr:hypothetical protein [Candidatus Sulfotelmatobacter sp.]